ncbi:MAG: DUF2237 family protein [Bacteriovoracaceae bacterium]
MKKGKNVLGTDLEVCCLSPKTGFLRDGFCQFSSQDLGKHLICVEITKEFLEFSKYLGNDLMTAKPEWGFPGLKVKDRWCVCASRWQEALDNEVAPPVYLEACDEKALTVVKLEDLKKYALKAT